MKILGIETSCDETAISVVEATGGLEHPKFKVLSQVVHSQIKEHEEFGGVVPNIAKREHTKNLPLVLAKALKEAGFEDGLSIMNYELWKEKKPNTNFPIDLIVVTVGPGLEPALWMGVNFAEELSKRWDIPLIGANHMEGHIASVLLNKTDKFSIPFPALALLISGNHTELVLLNSWAEKRKIGETVDDAVGEAFDKVARMLGLPYPGGPEINKLAIEARRKNKQLETRFPRPMIHSKDFNFSFSGLKTAVLYYLRGISSTPSLLKGKKQGEVAFPLSKKIEVAREFEDAVVETLLSKTRKAVDKYRPKTLIIGGGVIANTTLRDNFLNLKNEYSDMEILIPEKELTTDNATMIAISGYLNLSNNQTAPSITLEADGNLKY